MTLTADRADVALSPRHRPFAVLVAVSDLGLRLAVVRTLRGMGAEVVVEVSTAQEARAVLGSSDLVVAEAGLPDSSGADLIRELKTRGTVRGIVISSSSDPFSVRGAVTSGVRAYLVTAAGQTMAVDPTSGVGMMSAREVQVLRLVADGRSNRDIGDRLALSALTVKSHLARIARKLGTGDRAEMVVVAMRAGVIT